MKTIHAVYENGVFRPFDEVELPEHCEVEFEPRLIGKPDDPAHRERIQALLAVRFNSGRRDIAERHDQHQP